jgi:hypothetical protein
MKRIARHIAPFVAGLTFIGCGPANDAADCIERDRKDMAAAAAGAAAVVAQIKAVLHTGTADEFLYDVNRYGDYVSDSDPWLASTDPMTDDEIRAGQAWPTDK